MNIESYTFNPFETNCYVISSGGHAAIIDPSCRERDEIRILVDAVRESGATVDRILLTHAHIDHIFGCKALCDEFDVELEVHADDVPLLENAVTQAAMFGIDLEEPPAPGRLIEPGESIEIGDATLDVLHTPGHSPGSVTFYNRDQDVAIAGDVLFKGSVGRTDLWKGSMPVLIESIFETLVPLGDTTRILPGHGPETTVGSERASNPFLQQGS